MMLFQLMSNWKGATQVTGVAGLCDIHIWLDLPLNPWTFAAGCHVAKFAMAMEEVIKDINFDEELGRLRHAQSSQSSCDSHGYHEPLKPLEPLEPLDLGTVRTFGPWKILVTLSLVSIGSMALCAHAKVAGAAHGAVEETVALGTWSDSIEGCR